MKLTFPMALFLVFLVLKLTGYVAWSWIWVTAPLWFGIAAAITLMGSVIVLAMLGAVAGDKK